MSLEGGDVVQVRVLGRGDAQVRVFADDLRGDSEIAKLMTPMPVIGDPESGDFSGFELFQEFIVGVGGAVTAEAIVSAIRSLGSRRKAPGSSERPADSEAEALGEPSVKTSASGDGVLEITIRISGS